MPGPPAQLQQQGERVHFTEDFLFVRGSLWILRHIEQRTPEFEGGDLKVILTFRRWHMMASSLSHWIEANSSAVGRFSYSGSNMDSNVILSRSL